MQWPWPKPKRSRSHKTFKGQSTHAHVCTYELKLWWGYIYFLDQKVSLVSSTGQLLEEFMPRRVVCVYLCATVNNCSFTQVLLSNVYQTLNTIDRYPWELCSFLVLRRKEERTYWWLVLYEDIHLQFFSLSVPVGNAPCTQRYGERGNTKRDPTKSDAPIQEKGAVARVCASFAEYGRASKWKEHTCH